MRVGILACSKAKTPAPRPAVELYQGRVFRAAVDVLRARGCARLVILSALHLALAEDDVVAPYERCLADLDAAGRRAWALRRELEPLTPASPA
jgi:hypothetical protein